MLSVPNTLRSSFAVVMITKFNFVCYDNFNTSLIFSEAWRKTLLNVTCSCHTRASTLAELLDLFWQTNRWHLNHSELICIKTILGAVSEKFSVIFFSPQVSYSLINVHTAQPSAVVRKWQVRQHHSAWGRKLSPVSVLSTPPKMWVLTFDRPHHFWN